MKWLPLLLATACSAAPIPTPEETTPKSDAGTKAPDAATELPDAPDDSSKLPECQAQRVVHVVAANASLAWFTLVWPAPHVIEQFTPGFAYDDPSRAAPQTVDPAHPLYARIVGDVPALTGTGMHPLVTAFVAGYNETITMSPDLTVTSNVDVLGFAAKAQASHKAIIPTIAIDSVANYGLGSGAPYAFVASWSDAAALVESKGVPATEISPDPTILAQWYGASSPSTLVTLGSSLLFAANAFRTNAASTVIMRGFDDDPHGAFASPQYAATMADSLAQVIHGFYTELARYPEPTCSHDGRKISLADNVVLVVTGDTPKNSFVASGWPDGTPSNSNYVYVRSNGFLRSGWFGSVAPSLATGFDPKTGALSGATALEDKNAEALALLYAITRGNGPLVASLGAAPYAGVVAP